MPKTALLAPLLLTSCLMPIGDPQPATPQRPTFSSDVNTTAYGTTEIEAGVLLDDNDEYELSTTVKHGVRERTEVFATFAPYRKVDLLTKDEEGIGDLVLGARHRLSDQVEEDWGLAVQGVIKVPTANERDFLGTGEFDFKIAGIGTRAVGDASVTAFWEVGAYGETFGGGHNAGHVIALAGSTSFTPEVSFFGELTFVGGSAFEEELFVTGGATYSTSPRWVIDVAVRGEIDDVDDSDEGAILIGFTRNLGEVLLTRP